MTYEDVLSFCEEQDVRFIRLSYFDMYGTQKNVGLTSNLVTLLLFFFLSLTRITTRFSNPLSE